MFLFEAGYSKIDRLGRELSQEALQTSTRVVILGYSKLNVFTKSSGVPIDVILGMGKSCCLTNCSYIPSSFSWTT